MTEAQLIANRANAQLSTGPRTEEGKRRSSLNDFRHGLTGQIVIHTPEDQAAFQKHCEAIRDALAPVGALELECEADGRCVLPRTAAPVGDPSFDLDAPSVPERRQLGDPELRAEGTDRIQRGG